VWHVVIERFPSLAGPCDPANPCTIKWVEEFGLLTVPTMALIAGSALIALTLVARTAPEPDPVTDHDPASDRSSDR
jgi:hypothetical protein